MLKELIYTIILVSAVMFGLVHSSMSAVVNDKQLTQIQAYKKDYPEYKSIFSRIQYRDGDPKISRLEFFEMAMHENYLKKNRRFFDLAGIPQLTVQTIEVKNEYIKQIQNIWNEAIK